MKNLRYVNVIKRDGSEVPFNSEKIYHAVKKAYISAGEPLFYYGEWPDDDALQVTEWVMMELASIAEHPFTEEIWKVSTKKIQNVVEKILMEKDPNVAKIYVSYK
nr:MAG TPA: anaerobic ribonucleoside triphosphate reductase [Caudoviricetes sp.]